MKKSTINHRVYVVVIAIIVVAIATFIGTSKIRAYSSALKAIDREDYQSAITILESLSGSR